VSYPARILVVGNGGRECALANALLLSPRVEALYIAPPNWGIVDPRVLHEADAPSRVSALELPVSDNAGIVAAAQEHRIDLVIIGPEAPLVAGLADELRNAGIPCVGPGRAAAQLEGSKRYAKQFMARHGLPTAAHREFHDAAALLAYVADCPLPVVLKADGLAAGKGVAVCPTREAAQAAAQALMVERVHGDSGAAVVVEECLTGPEISFICLVAGGRAEVLPPGSDYKRLRDGDQGPNTGGMGNICPTPHCDDDTLVEFVRDILAPTVRGLAADGLDYRGFLFVGTMQTPQGLKVIEYNVRFGDPEAEVMLPLCDCDWPAVLAGVAAGELPRADLAPGGFTDHPGQHGPIRLRDGACVAVMLASAGYPEAKAPPARIDGLERVFAQGLLTPPPRADGQGWDPPAVQVCFAGVSVGAELARPGTVAVWGPRAEQAPPLLATGGRVLCISARAADLSLARRLAYEVAGNIHFEGMQLRTDIGKLR
jgi:phosphoribosylamine--glycine ligase